MYLPRAVLGMYSKWTCLLPNVSLVAGYFNKRDNNKLQTFNQIEKYGPVSWNLDVFYSIAGHLPASCVNFKISRFLKSIISLENTYIRGIYLILWSEILRYFTNRRQFPCNTELQTFMKHGPEKTRSGISKSMSR